MDKEVMVERSHRSLVQRGAGDRSRVIIAKLHNEGDALTILRKAEAAESNTMETRLLLSQTTRSTLP